MSTSRVALLAALACAVAWPAAATAQSTRERIRVEKERADREQAERERAARERQERERALQADREDRARAERRRYEDELLARERERDRERERAQERAREAREDALERARETRERALRLERERVARERSLQNERAARERALQSERTRRLAEERRATELRRELERERAVRLREQRARDLRRRYRDEWRPRVSLSGGIDIREFDGANDRYVAQAGVDFRTRGGLGMRPEVTYAWTDRGGTQVAVGATGVPTGSITVGRNQAIGVMLNATYTFFRSSMVRPYVLGGPGVISTRIAPVSTSGIVVQPGTPTTLPTASARHELDVGLNAGAGLELSLGPVRLFSETRYFLTDSPAARGFSGMVPITAGIRF